jgi:hypothetical protein
MAGARLNGADFKLEQFTRQQVLSFHYKDIHAIEYVNAIYDYIEQNEESRHKLGFQRARLLILSFINNHP